MSKSDNWFIAIFGTLLIIAVSAGFSYLLAYFGEPSNLWFWQLLGVL